MKKERTVRLAAALLSMAMSIPSFAAGWQQNVTGWWYGTNADNTQWYANGWQWIDGNGDGTAECYYFDENGYALMNTTTPDGYTVDANGAWVDGGVVQTQTAAASTAAGTETGAVENGTAADYNWLNNVVWESETAGEKVWKSEWGTYDYLSAYTISITGTETESWLYLYEGDWDNIDKAVMVYSAPLEKLEKYEDGHIKQAVYGAVAITWEDDEYSADFPSVTVDGLDQKYAGMYQYDTSIS